MATLSITQAWNETAEFVRREAGLLFPISFLLLSLPGALVQVVQPAPITPGQPAPAGFWLLLMPLALVAAIIGNVAIAYLALKPGASVREALQRGVARLLPLLGISVMIGIAFFILAMIAAVIAFVLVPGALEAAEAGAPTPAAMTALLATLLILVPIALYVAARLMMMTPAVASEEGGPFALIGRSWRLTAGNAWKLVGFLLLVLVAMLVLLAAIAAVAGILLALVVGRPDPGSTSFILVAVILAIVRMVVAAYVVTLVARIYAQLAGTATPEVFA